MTTGGSREKKEHMKVGITFSTFDLFHAGHVKMLEEAKRKCDYLIVGLQLDPSIDRPEKNGPSQSIIERYIQLKGSKHVDEIVPYVSEQDLEDILRSFKLDVRIIGDEYKEKNFTGRSYCEEKGIQNIIYVESKYDALKDADALVLLTEWKEFRSPDFEEMKTQLKTPVIFDGRNQYIAYDIENKGLEYYRIGK
jgi:glycerol-3-phosphate cytidylyltransferase